MPELNKESGNDICFKFDGVICVVLAHSQKPGEGQIQLMADIQNYLTPKIDRGGIKYKFGWLNVSTQAPFAKLLSLNSGNVPKVVMINPGKRKRYYTMDEEINEPNLSIVLK